MAIANGNMQGYGGGQSVPNYAPQGGFGVAMTPSGKNFDPMVSDMSQQGNQAAPVAPQMYNQQVQQSVPNYQVPQVQQQPMAGYGGYAQQPMQQNPYGNQRQSSRQGPQRLY
jgi:hypothetical protein